MAWILQVAWGLELRLEVTPMERTQTRDAGAPTTLAETPLAEVMTLDVACLTPEYSVESATELFIDRGIGGAPVIDEDGRPVGVISQTDLLRENYYRGETQQAERHFVQHTPGYHIDDLVGYQVERLARQTVGEIMTPVVLTLRPDATVVHAAALMAEARVHRVPIVDDDGRVIGLVTALDLLEHLAGGAATAPRPPHH